MKILWIDLNSSYAHSSLALPALHAQIAKNNSVKWEIVSATINENVGMIVDEIYRHQPDIIAATTWLFNHEQLLHITARLKALLPNSYFILGGPEFLGNNEDFLHKNPFIDCVFRGEGEEIPPMAVLLEPAGKVEQYSGTLLYESSKAIYRQRHSPCT